MTASKTFYNLCTEKNEQNRKQRKKYSSLLEINGSCVAHPHTLSLLISAKIPNNYCPSASGKGTSALEKYL